MLRDRASIVGRLEARVAGAACGDRAATHDWDFDPGMEGHRRRRTRWPAMGYFIEHAGLRSRSSRYEVLSIRHATRHWNWSRGEEQGQLASACTSPDLSRALRRNRAPARARRQRPLRPRHAVRPPATGRSRSWTSPADVLARASRTSVLRRRPHDVHAASRSRTARVGPCGLAEGDVAAWPCAGRRGPIARRPRRLTPARCPPP